MKVSANIERRSKLGNNLIKFLIGLIIETVLYEHADALLNKIFRYTFILWTTFAIPVGTSPFLIAFGSFLIGKYNRDWWHVIYDAFW